MSQEHAGVRAGLGGNKVAQAGRTRLHWPASPTFAEGQSILSALPPGWSRAPGLTRDAGHARP